MKNVYVVYGFDYHTKKDTSLTIDKRDITQFVCRVFAKMEDVEKYITQYFNKHATDDTVLNMSKLKNGYFSANMTNRQKDNGIIYGTEIEVTVQEITEEIGDCNLFGDIYSVFNG